MCTVSIITLDESVSCAGPGYRVVCNRDENRRRPPAAAPKWRSVDGAAFQALWPMDLEAGGTWLAAGEQGLSLCMLNLNPEPPINLRGHGKLRSRGLIIPELIGAQGLSDVAAKLSRMNLRHFAPFRLVGVELSDAPALRVLESRWDRRGLDIAWHGQLPVCFVSSGLGDSRALPRLDLFEETVVAPGANPERQDEFHRHVWPARPEISVMMTREDARTVSVSTLEVLRTEGSPSISMGYEPIPESAPVSVAAVRTLAR